MPGPFARMPSGRSLGEAAGSGPLWGAGEEGHEKGYGDSKERPAQELSDSSSDGPEAPSSREGEEEEEEASPPPVEGGKKRKAAISKEDGGSKKGKTLPSDYSNDAGDGGGGWQAWGKPPGKSHVSGYPKNS